MWLKKHFQRSLGGLYPTVEFPFFRVSSFWSFPFSYNLSWILFRNRYKDSLLYHIEKSNIRFNCCCTIFHYSWYFDQQKMFSLHEVKISKFINKWRYRFANSSKNAVIVYVFFFTLFNLYFIQVKKVQSNTTLHFRKLLA